MALDPAVATVAGVGVEAVGVRSGPPPPEPAAAAVTAHCRTGPGNVSYKCCFTGGDRFRLDGYGDGGMPGTSAWPGYKSWQTLTANDNGAVAGRIGFGAPAFAMAA